MTIVSLVSFYHHTVTNFSLMIRTFKIYSFSRVFYYSLLEFKMYSTLLTIVTMLYITFSWLIYFITISCNFRLLHQFLTMASPVAQTVKSLLAMWAISGSEFPWRRKWQPSPVFLPGESHGWRSLVGCSPWGHREQDTAEWLPRTHPFHAHFNPTSDKHQFVLCELHFCLFVYVINITEI